MNPSELVAELRKPLPKLPAYLLYDARGGQLFDEITTLDEYYQTRTEIALLESVAPAVLQQVQPRRLAELGSGSAAKIGAFLGRMQPGTCQLLDVNADALQGSIARLSEEFSGWDFRAEIGSFVGGADALGVGGGPRLVLFFGGTIGNFHPTEVPGFLRDLGRIMEPGDGLLIGVDRVKDVARLEAAYNDARGVTAAFNKNVLAVLNHSYGANFDLSRWAHRAVWDAEQSWMHLTLRSEVDQEVRLGDAVLRFAEGAEISTEISCKYTEQSFGARVDEAGMRLVRWDTDPDGLFALALVQGA